MGNETKFGLTTEETANISELPQAYNLGSLEVGETKKFTVLEAEPREVSFNKDGKEQKQLIINVRNEDDGLTYGMWLSAKSLRLEFFKLYEQEGSLENVAVVIGKRSYEHEKYGKVVAYTVQKNTE